MTEVMEAVLNGVEGEETNPTTDESTVGDKTLVIAEEQEDMKDDEMDTGTAVSVPEGEQEDTSDSISSLPGANLTIATDDEKEQQEGEDGRQDENGEDDESKHDLDEGGTNENGDDSNMEISDDVNAVKVDDMYVGEVEDQNSNASLEESESGLIISTESPSGDKQPSWNALQNGETNTNEDNSSSSSSGENNKPLLTSLLGGKEGGSTSKKSAHQSRSFSVSDGNAIAKELEDQVGKLEELLVLKEKEWSSILRLKKHMEYALEQVKCTQRIAKVQDGMNGPMSTTEIKACMNMITSEKDMFSLAERQIEESIESTETENESLQTIFPFRSSSNAQTASSNQSGQEEGVGQKEDILTASAALQKLCERKRKAMDEPLPNRVTRPRVAGTQSNSNASTQGQGLLPVQGRKGNMVNVQSIIATHRNNLAGDRPKGGLKPFKRLILKLNPERSYHKTLEELIAMAQADRLQKEAAASLAVPVPTVPLITSTRTLVSNKPKNGKSTGRQTAVSTNSLLISNPSPSGSGTLAKMLSPSTHSTRAMNDASTNASQKFSNKLPTSDANLSLANLLATSKVESKVNMSKIKKERTREDEASHVPSQQQQADAVPVCQGCNLSRAQFVCAGCANQWYCSRECQVAAWDEHSEICSG